MLLPHFELNPAKAFGRKTSEHELAKKMKDKFKLMKKPCGYSINSITNPMDEVLTPVVSLVA